MSDIETGAPTNTKLLFTDKDDNSSHPPDVTKVSVSGDGGEYIHFGHQKYLKSELVQAFGGTLNPGLSPPPINNFANPAPLGLSAFALTTFVLSMCNARAMGVKTPNIVVGLAFFYGGLTQLVAGMWEIAVGNTFGGCALSSYGGFWGSYAAIQVNGFNIITAYDGRGEELRDALGFFLLAWAIFTFFMCLCTMKSTLAFFSLFFFLFITFLLLSIGEFSNKVGVTRAGGVFGVITAFIAWYNAYAGIANEQNSYITVKAFQLPDLEEKFRKTK